MPKIYCATSYSESGESYATSKSKAIKLAKEKCNAVDSDSFVIAYTTDKPTVKLIVDCLNCEGWAVSQEVVAHFKWCEEKNKVIKV